MSKNTNEIPKIGDTIMCLHMDGESQVTPGTIGVVTGIGKDPFEDDGYLIQMKWDNGSTLALVSVADAWKHVKRKIDEQEDRTWDYITDNEDIFENFDWRWLEKYLYKLRDTGIVNMYGASPLLYSGKEYIDRYYGEGLEDDEKFQEFLEDAETSKNKIIQGVLKYMERHNKDIHDLSLINRYAQNFSHKMLGLYMVLSNVRNMS